MTAVDRAPVAPSTHLAGVDVPPAILDSGAGPGDIKFAARLLKPLDVVTAHDTAAEYLRRYQLNGNRSANIWLRTTVEDFEAQEAALPVPLRDIREDGGRERVAHRFATDCINITMHLTEGMTTPADPAELLHQVSAPARQWGLELDTPTFSSPPTDRQLDKAASILARLQDVDWWQRQIASVFTRHREHVARCTGKVRKGVSPYASRKAVTEYKAKKAHGARWLAGHKIVNLELELERSLADAHAASVSNPEIRRTELMVRMRGCEDYANLQGLAADFLTITTPSQYHAWKTTKEGRTVRNGKFNGSTPRQGQQYLCRQWAKARAQLAREGIRFYGFRVAEPHSDGTPHWHMMLFVQPAHRDRLREIIGHYACEHDQHELKKGRRARFDAVAIDPSKGSATGYIAKYIAKNIDGHRVGDDYEAEASAGDTAINVAAWSSLWGIRQFQQVGGPGVSIWRELRRIRGKVEDPQLETARAAADHGKWADYIAAMGGIALPRKERPIQLAHLVKPCHSKYGEDVKTLVGIQSAAAGTLTTRLQGWEIVSRTRLAVGFGERSELPLSLPLSGDSRALGDLINNCTQDNSGPSLAQSLARIGLDMTDYRRMLAGAVVTIDGLYCWIRNGALNQSKKRPQFRPERERVPPCEEAHAWERAARLASHDKARAVVRDDMSLAQYLAEGDQPLSAVEMLGEALRQERRQAPDTFQEDPRLVKLAGQVAARQASHDRARAVVRDELSLGQYLAGEAQTQYALKALNDALRRERRQDADAFRKDPRLVKLTTFVAARLQDANNSGRAAL